MDNAKLRNLLEFRYFNYTNKKNILDLHLCKKYKQITNDYYTDLLGGKIKVFQYDMMSISRNIIKNICLSLLTLLPICNLNADVCKNETSTQGTEFWIAFLQNHDEELIIPHGLDLIIAADKTTDIRIENNVLLDEHSEDGLYHWNITMEANSTNVITVPCQLFNPAEYGTVIDRTLHIKSTEPISVYMDNRQNFSDDATLALPISACGSYYIIQTAEGVIDSNYDTFKPSIFSVIATENNTTVQITPSIMTSDGHAANVPYTVTLQKGQLYQVQSTPTDIGSGFSGTQVLSTKGQKIAVYVGNRMANIPPTNIAGNSNNLFDVSIPVSKWGKNFIIQPFKTGVIDMIKITASKDNTEIYKNGNLLATINALESYEFLAEETKGPFKLETTEPVSVYQYMTGNNYVYQRANGGPSLQYVNPVEQSINKLSFCTPNNTNITNNFINLVIKTKDASNIKLDGQKNFAKFTPIDNTYSTGYAIISNGQHTLESNSGFIANLYGIGNGVSYAYCAGSNVYDINSKSNKETTICWGDTVLFAGKKITEPGFYIDTLKNKAGCDSLVFLTLKTLSSDTVYYHDTIRIGESYNKNGFVYQTPQPGVYYEIGGECPNYNNLELTVEYQPCFNGTLIFKEDFGGNNSTDPVVSNQKIHQCSYELNANPIDLYLKGLYSIRKVSYPDKAWVNIVDHTYPDRKDRGYFMQCDASNISNDDPGTLYSMQIDDLCDSIPLYFSFYGLSMIKAGADTTYSNAKLKLVIEDTEGNVLRSKNIEMLNGKETWGLFGMTYQMPEGKTSAVFKILNNNTVNYGNDFAIDDIEVHFCKQSVDVTEIANNSCAGSDLSLSADFTNDGSYKEPVVYEWYYSPNPQIQSTDWTLVGNEKDLEISNLNESNNGFYRVFVGDAGAQNIINNCSPASDLIEVNVKKCTTPICNADTIKLTTCVTIDTLINILDNDTISNRDNAIISLINPPAYTKIVGNMLAYTLVDLDIVADTVIYSVTLGDFSDTTSVIFKIDHPSKAKKINAQICEGSKYHELILYKDTIISDTTIMKESGCPSIINHIVKVNNIDAEVNDTSLCLGNKATLTAKASEKYNYVWYHNQDHTAIAGKGQTLTIKPTKSTKYYIIASNEKCTKELTAIVEVNSKPYIESVVIEDDKNLEIIANGGSGSYEFKIDKQWTSNNIIKNFTENKFYQIQVRDDEGCISDTTIKAPIHGLDIPIVVSPNGDGTNDVFEIKNIDKYPEATIKIYDAKGMKLVEYKANDYKGWDGYYNGIRMSSDDYWYEINIKEIDKIIVGHFTLIRD